MEKECWSRESDGRKEACKYWLNDNCLEKAVLSDH